MEKFSEVMDTSRFDRLLGEMLGAIAELEVEGHNVMHVADAAVLAAVRKVHQTQAPSVTHAWCQRIAEALNDKVRLSDRLANTTQEAAGSTHRGRLN